MVGSHTTRSGRHSRQNATRSPTSGSLTTFHHHGTSRRNPSRTYSHDTPAEAFTVMSKRGHRASTTRFMTCRNRWSWPTGTAVRPLPAMASTSSGWLATRTSCPAVRSAQASVTRLKKCDLSACVAMTTRIRMLLSERDVAGLSGGR